MTETCDVLNAAQDAGLAERNSLAAQAACEVLRNAGVVESFNGGNYYHGRQAYVLGDSGDFRPESGFTPAAQVDKARKRLMHAGKGDSVSRHAGFYESDYSLTLPLLKMTEPCSDAALMLLDTPMVVRQVVRLESSRDDDLLLLIDRLQESDLHQIDEQLHEALAPTGKASPSVCAEFIKLAKPLTNRLTFGREQEAFIFSCAAIGLIGVAEWSDWYKDTMAKVIDTKRVQGNPISEGSEAYLRFRSIADTRLASQ